MPARSAKQAALRRAIAHSDKFAKKASIPQSVGREYSDKTKKAKKK